MAPETPATAVADWIVVAPDGWARPLGEQLAQRLLGQANLPAAARFLDDVYEAAAAALLARRSAAGGSILLSITVDYLSPAQMQIFSALAHLDGIQTLALSACDRPKKLMQARLLGAHQTLLLPLAPHQPPLPQPPASQAASPRRPFSPPVMSEITAAALAAAVPFQPSSPPHTPPVSHAKPGPPIRRRRTRPDPPDAHDQPLLTQEELDALLG